MKKTLIVTGASSDMGTLLIKNAKNEYQYILAQYRTKNDALKKVLGECSSTVLEFQADFSSDEETKLFASHIKDLTDTIKDTEIHFVHFPAVQFESNRFHKTSWDTIQKEFDVSIRSFVYVSQALIPIMTKSKCGRIITLLSYLVENIPAKYCSDYILIKNCLLSLTKSLAVEYAEKGITVNGVSPSRVNTKFISNQSDLMLQGWIDKSPLKRDLTADEVVPTIQFLLSEGASRINGENIIVSCGMSAT